MKALTDFKTKHKEDATDFVLPGESDIENRKQSTGF